jgi:hypothetical protein
MESTEGGARPWYVSLFACFSSKPVTAVAADAAVAVADDAVVAADAAVADAAVADAAVADAAAVVAAVADAAALDAQPVAVRSPLETVSEEPDPE